jgi:hypothetical protein
LKVQICGIIFKAYDKNVGDGSICESKLLKLGPITPRWVIMSYEF